MFKRLWRVLGLLCLLFTGRAEADQILTASGEPVTGKIGGIEEGSLLFAPSTGEPRKWPLQDLRRITFGPSRPKGPLQVRPGVVQARASVIARRLNEDDGAG